MPPSKPQRIAFICTGNVCRSPMAEYLLRQRLGRQTPWEVVSAGLAAAPGQPASSEAIQTLRARRINLKPHRSRPVSREWIDAATLLVVMTRSHRELLLNLFPGCGDRVYLLKTFGPADAEADVHDPIGQPRHVYEKTCRDIEAALPGLIQYLETYNRTDQPT